MVTLIAAAFKAIAFVNRSLPTICGMMACLAGPISANSTPCNTDAVSRWYHVTVSVVIEIPTPSAISSAPTCPAWMMRLRSTLSAITPPNSTRLSIGTDDPAFTMPRMVAESVRSYTRYPRASICICIPAMIASCPSHRNRKWRLDSDLNEFRHPPSESLSGGRRCVVP